MILLLALALQCPDGSPPPCRQPVARAAVPSTSVAVLYFDSRSRDSNDLYLADGITEEIITRLAGVQRLTVRSRHVVQRYRGTAMTDPAAVGRTLNVAYLVTGSLRRAGGRLRLNAELIRADGGAQVWGRQFDQAGDDVFAIQEAVANEVATGIVGRLLPNEARAVAIRPTSNAAAYEAFIRARFHLARRDAAGVTRALAEYQTALRAEPGWVDALAGTAMALGIGNANGLDIGMPPESSAARAMRAAGEAIRLAPGSSEAWTAMGVARVAADHRHHTGARQALERAIALDSTNAEAHHLLGFTLAVSDHDSLGLIHDRHALAINPMRPVTLQHLFQEALIDRRYGEARVWLDSILKLAPDFGPTQAGVIPLLILEGDTAHALELYRALPRAAPGAPASRAGYYAGAAALLGDSDAAMAWLEAARPRGLFIRYFMRMPLFDRVRTDPRFARLYRELSPS